MASKSLTLTIKVPDSVNESNVPWYLIKLIRSIPSDLLGETEKGELVMQPIRLKDKDGSETEFD